MKRTNRANTKDKMGRFIIVMSLSVLNLPSAKDIICGGGFGKEPQTARTDCLRHCILFSFIIIN